MDNKDLLQKIESLQKRLSELESQNKQNLSMFGRSYSQVGNSNSDFLIKTKGQVKIQWGSKFIDLIKDGKINVDSKFIYKENSIGVKDGIYVIGDNEDQQVVLKVGDAEVNLKGELGATYVSFQGEQKSSSDQKYQALQNIGFLYKDLNSINTDSLQNGIVYIESEQKLYIISNGSLQQFSVEFPNPYNKQFILTKEDSNIGALVIKGFGKENSIVFESMIIYSQNDRTYFDSDRTIYTRVNGVDKMVISDNKVIFSNVVVSQEFQSSNAFKGQGFRLYDEGGTSTLEIDNLVLRGQTYTLPIGSIIMFGGKSTDIPEGWAICDGQNGTPNLIGKFIKASSTSGEEGDLGDNTNNGNNINGDQTATTLSAEALDMSSVQLSQEEQDIPLKIEFKYYSLIYIMKII